MIKIQKSLSLNASFDLVDLAQFEFLQLLLFLLNGFVLFLTSFLDQLLGQRVQSLLLLSMDLLLVLLTDRAHLSGNLLLKLSQ